MSKSLSKPHYANVILIGQDGKHLSTISTKKAKWYLDRSLVVEIPPPAPYARALQLTFPHKQKTDSEVWDLAVTHNQCVMCGTDKELTLHHIVPRVIRRHLPIEVKGHAREWCALLCEPCHTKVELVSQPIYKENFPEYSPREEDMNLSLQVIKSKGNLEKIPAEKLKEMLSRSEYKSADEIPDIDVRNRMKIHLQRSNTQQRLITKWANDFIAEQGGVDGVHRYFYDLFITFKPKYLPEWFGKLINK